MSAIRSLEILSVKKEPKLSARDMTEEIEGNGDGTNRRFEMLTSYEIASLNREIISIRRVLERMADTSSTDCGF